MKQYQGVAIEVKEKKTGVTNNKKWVISEVLFELKDHEQIKFSTFNGDKWERNKGQVTQVYLEETKYGLQEVSAKKAEENIKHEEIMKGLREIYKLLDERTK